MTLSFVIYRPCKYPCKNLKEYIIYFRIFKITWLVHTKLIFKHLKICNVVSELKKFQFCI